MELRRNRGSYGLIDQGRKPLFLLTFKEIDMPKGMGTYGTKKGRPPKKKGGKKKGSKKK